MTPNNIVLISGPTASGKSFIADLFSQKFESTIINADSMQLYKNLPILTALPKDLKDNQPKYNLYGILDYKEACSVGHWLLLAKQAINDAIANNKKAIIVGGTGFYLKALLYGMTNIPQIDSETRSRVRELFQQIGKENFYKLLCKKDPHIEDRIKSGDSQRMMRAMEVFEQTGQSITTFKQELNKPLLTNYVHICLMPDRKFLYENCNTRFDDMIANGVIDEIAAFKSLISEDNDTQDYVIFKAIGFRQIASYIDGYLDLQEAIEKAKQLTRNYAKRQLTWFKHQMPDKICINYDSITALQKGVMSLYN